jgi:REP element-mobilizing transposase RayT
MARPLRVEYPGAYYHVINRGNAGEEIFKNARDREKFLEYLATAVARFSVVVHTYCLMSNHFHLLLQTQEANLSKAIQWLNVSYATYFNKKRQRSGHLFQGRFKAILIDADQYLEQLSRYIHLNPVQAKIVATPVEYPWSSYPAFVGKTKNPEWLTTGEILGHFGKRRNTAIKKYKSFVEEINIAALADPHAETFGGFILGDTPFIKWVQNTFLASQENSQEIPELKKLTPRVPPARILQAVCVECKCEKEKVVKKGKHRSHERAMAIYLTRDLSGLSGKELGSFFGVSGAAITMRYNQFSREINKNKKLGKRIQKIKKQLLNS